MHADPAMERGGGLFRLHTGRMYRDGMITVFCPGSIQSFVLRKVLILLYVIRIGFLSWLGIVFRATGN